MVLLLQLKPTETLSIRSLLTPLLRLELSFRRFLMDSRTGTEQFSGKRFWGKGRTVADYYMFLLQIFAEMGDRVFGVKIESMGLGP
jgi:hypothetical protein